MKHLHVTGISLCLFCLLSCGKSDYDVTAPRPSLEVNALQQKYVVGEPTFIQVKASQRGYDGKFELSTALIEGACEIAIGDTPISTTGEWLELTNKTEILTLIPSQAGALRITFDVKTAKETSSGRSTLNLKVEASATLQFSAESPLTSSIKDPIEIVLTATKKGFSGVIPILYQQASGTGKLQFGAIVTESGNKFSIPANGAQTLYYTPAERGVHELQFSATDGYTTEYQSLEIIVTN